VQSRFHYKLYLEPDKQSFCKWLVNNGYSERATAFQAYDETGDMLLSGEANIDMEAHPCPRTVAYAETVLTTYPSNVWLPLLSGTCGYAWAQQRIAFEELFAELPDPAQLMKDPAGVTLPTENSAIWALTGLLAGMASRKTADAVATVVRRLPTKYMVACIHDAMNRSKEFINTSACTALNLEYSAIL
jgi:hypothetical protein